MSEANIKLIKDFIECVCDTAQKGTKKPSGIDAMKAILDIEAALQPAPPKGNSHE